MESESDADALRRKIAELTEKPVEDDWYGLGSVFAAEQARIDALAAQTVDKWERRRLLLLKGVGFVTRTFVYLMLALLLWSALPDIAQRPLSNVTVNEVISSLLLLVLIIFLGWRFFNPKQRDPLSFWYYDYWEAWGALGLSLVGIAMLAMAWFSRATIKQWIVSWTDPVGNAIGNAINTFSNTTIGEWLGNILFIGAILAVNIFLLAIVWAYVSSIYRWAAAKVRGRH